MQIDLNLLPSTFDLVHVGLAAALLLFLALQVLLLTVAVLVLLRRRRERSDAAASALESSVRKLPEQAESPAKRSAARIEQSPLKESSPDAALQLLGLLQNDARFIDFIQENVAAFSDAEVGAAARVVHEGCRKILRQHFELEPVRAEAENSRVTLSKGFDASAVRLSGNIVGDPPFTGTLVHRGWRVSRIKLPKIADGHDTRIIAAAEVEL